jgi:hypothetical protein
MKYYTFTGKKREKSKNLLFCHAPISASTFYGGVAFNRWPIDR